MEFPVPLMEVRSGGEAGNALVHIHIPKTAGTSIRNVLVNTFSPKDVFYYNCGNDSFIRSSDRGLLGSERMSVDKFKKFAYRSGYFSVVRPLFKRAAAREQQHYLTPQTFFSAESKLAYRAVSGHFEASQVALWGLENNRGLSIVREPLARVVSHYHHYIRAQGKLGSLGSSLAANRPELMTLDEFVELPVLTNIQTRYLGQLANIKIATIATCSHLFEELGISSITPKHLNETPNADIYNLGATATAKFIERNVMDYELFYGAQSQWQ